MKPICEMNLNSVNRTIRVGMKKFTSPISFAKV